MTEGGTARSTLQSVAVVNTIQRIEPVAAAGMRTGVLQGQRSLQVIFFLDKKNVFVAAAGMRTGVQQEV